MVYTSMRLVDNKVKERPRDVITHDRECVRRARVIYYICIWPGESVPAGQVKAVVTCPYFTSTGTLITLPIHGNQSQAGGQGRHLCMLNLRLIRRLMPGSFTGNVMR